MNKVFSCKAIFFDAGQTLFRPHPSVGAIYARVGARYGVGHSAQILEERFHAQWQKAGGLASLQGPATPGLEKQWWRSLVREVFSEIEPEEKFESFFQDLYSEFGHASNWRLYPEVKETLAQLKARGFCMGIISNWDSRLLGLCRDMGLEPLFDFILISAVVGHSKPGKRIFQDALKLAGCDAQEAVHVGDSVDDDYKAALAAGLGAIHVDRRGVAGPGHTPNGNIFRIQSLSDVIACVRPC